MPVRKGADGYYWGKQGPFKTRGEALKVQRAAHANGYKGGGKKRKTPPQDKQTVSLGSRG